MDEKEEIPEALRRVDTFYKMKERQEHQENLVDSVMILKQLQIIRNKIDERNYLLSWTLVLQLILNFLFLLIVIFFFLMR